MSAPLNQEIERACVLRVCTGCHSLDYYVSPRSRKAWELTVANMLGFAQHGEKSFTESEAERVVNYMGTYFDENSTLNVAEHFNKAIETAPKAIRAEAPSAIRKRLEHPGWQPSHALKRVAATGGYLAVLCTLVLLASGHNRRRLSSPFRSLHTWAALGLFLGLAAHAMIHLAQYGTPRVLWYWFGLAAFLVLVLAQLQGIIRKKFGRVFLRVHVASWGPAGDRFAVRVRMPIVWTQLGFGSNVSNQ